VSELSPTFSDRNTMPFKNKVDRYASQAAYRKVNFVKLWILLCASKCYDCEYSNPIALQFDHLPGTDKKFEISKAVAGSTRSWKAIQQEIDKCQIVCANCHLIRTATRGSYMRFEAHAKKVRKAWRRSNYY
jgi:hypothetical protein